MIYCNFFLSENIHIHIFFTLICTFLDTYTLGLKKSQAHWKGFIY